MRSTVLKLSSPCTERERCEHSVLISFTVAMQHTPLSPYGTEMVALGIHWGMNRVRRAPPRVARGTQLLTLHQLKRQHDLSPINNLNTPQQCLTFPPFPANHLPRTLVLYFRPRDSNKRAFAKFTLSAAAAAAAMQIRYKCLKCVTTTPELPCSPNAAIHRDFRH